MNGMLFLKARAKSPVEELSPAQAAIARLIAAGLRYKEVARELDLSPLTVRNQLHNIYAKLNVRDRATLARRLGETT